MDFDWVVIHYVISITTRNLKPLILETGMQNMIPSTTLLRLIYYPLMTTVIMTCFTCLATGPCR